MLTLDTVLTQNKLCPVRIIGDGLLIMSADGTSTHSLKDLGAYVWNQIDGKSDLNAIKMLILGSFETTEQKAEQDLISFANQLLGADLVTTNKI